MEKKAFVERARCLLNRLKYPGMILIVGMALLLIPCRKDGTAQRVQEKDSAAVPEDHEDWEARLEKILTVRVMLTLEQGSQTVYQQDRELGTDQDEAGKNRRERTETVILSRGGSSQEALVTQVMGPRFRGALIVCSGGDDPGVRLAVVQAVCSVTGLGADQVTVLKMK